MREGGLDVWGGGGIRFRTDMHYGEDTYFNYCVYMALTGKKQGCVVVDTPVYCYRDNPVSSMHRIDDKAITQHTKDLFLMAWLFKNNAEGGTIMDKDKLKNTRLRQYGATQGGLVILPCTSLNRRMVFRALRAERLYPYPFFTWTFNGKSIKGKIIEALKIGLRFEPYYCVYYLIRKLVDGWKK